MKKKILIVEDNTVALELLRELLVFEGLEVFTAMNGKDAIDKFYLYSPDLIITDLQMPKMDGFEFIQKVKAQEKLKSIPIIVFTASATPAIEEKCARLGVSMFIKKPSPSEKILESIEHLLKD